MRGAGAFPPLSVIAEDAVVNIELAAFNTDRQALNKTEADQVDTRSTICHGKGSAVGCILWVWPDDSARYTRDDELARQRGAIDLGGWQDVVSCFQVDVNRAAKGLLVTQGSR